MLEIRGYGDIKKKIANVDVRIFGYKHTVLGVSSTILFSSLNQPGLDDIKVVLVFCVLDSVYMFCLFCCSKLCRLSDLLKQCKIWCA